jgi:CBS-domain-containing membrane protein
LTKVAAMTISPCASIEDARQRMVASAVRLLLVTDQNNCILGLITATDLTSERPMRYLQRVGGRREEIFVRDIMTPEEKLETLQMVDVANARVGDIIETLKHVGRQHALVVDLDEQRRQMVRGIFSVKQISKQLGVVFEPTEVARTFAELEEVLSA